MFPNGSTQNLYPILILLLLILDVVNLTITLTLNLIRSNYLICFLDKVLFGLHLKGNHLLLSITAVSRLAKYQATVFFIDYIRLIVWHI